MEETLKYILYKNDWNNVSKNLIFIFPQFYAKVSH